MPTVMTHAVIGLTAGTLVPCTARRPLFWALSAVLPVLPDLDVIGARFGVAFFSIWGHRGISHSLAAAVVIGVATSAVVHRRFGGRPIALAVYFAAIVASHGVFDAFTDGGPGVALL